jgi:hypothetical protein
MQAEAMWKTLWKKWTIDKPARLGDWLWDVFVVQLAALLGRLTLRRAIALIPLVVFIVAYYHRIPLPPEFVFLGDLLAYLDVVSVLLIIGMLSRATTILFLVKQAAARIGALANRVVTEARRLDFRHRREGGGRARKRSAGRPKADGDEPFVAPGVAWA